MTPIRVTALLAAFVFALMAGVPSHAKPINKADDAMEQPNNATLEHIERLEQMLRDAGVDPPARPDAVAQPVPNRPERDEPILPASFATVVFETESAAINERGSKASLAILHIRRWLTKDDVKRRVAAQDIIKALDAWADREMARVQSSGDDVEAYILADDAIQTLGQDPLAKPFKDYLKQLQRKHRGLSALKAMAAYRRALIDAQAVGLTGDWALIDFQNTDVRLAIKDIKARLALIVNTWPKSEAGQTAEDTLQEWDKREAQAIADLPAWRYTWQLDLINIGTEKKTTIVTTADGTVIIDEDQRQVYDPEKVLLYGTFQNTSDKPYRYTFVVGVTSSAWPTTPFTKLGKNQLIGFELIQTPMLQPGELHNWQAYVAVDNIRNLHRGGVSMVEVRERNAGR